MSEKGVGRRALMGGIALCTASCVGGARLNAQSSPLARNNGRRLDVRDFGARGDRQHDDGPSIAAAVVAAARHDQYPSSVFLPSGHYHRRDTIALRDHLNLTGEGDSSVLNSQGDQRFNRPILSNASTKGLVHARLSDLSLIGGSHGLKLTATAENADVRMTNIGMDLQSVANIEADKLFQTAKLTNCSFARAPYGLKVNGYGTNLLLANAVEWTEHSKSSIYLRGTEAVTFIGNRFEAGGRRGEVSIDIEDANTVSFIGCWFEDIHETLGRFRDVAGQILFQSCHFTGTKLGGSDWQSFRWDVDDSLLTFRDCLSMVPMVVNAHVDLNGSIGISSSKAVLAGSDQSGSLTAAPQRVTGTRMLSFSVGPSRPGPWAIIGRLSVVLLDADDAIMWQHETPDMTLRSADPTIRTSGTSSLALRIRRGGENNVILSADMPERSRGSRLWWRFTWSTFQGGVTVRMA